MQIERCAYTKNIFAFFIARIAIIYYKNFEENREFLTNNKNIALTSCAKFRCMYTIIPHKLRCMRFPI